LYYLLSISHREEEKHKISGNGTSQLISSPEAGFSIMFSIMVSTLDWSLISHGKIFKYLVSSLFPRINERKSPKFGPHSSITLWNPVKSKCLFYDGIHFKIGATATHIGDTTYAFRFTSLLVWILWIEWGGFDVPLEVNIFASIEQQIAELWSREQDQENLEETVLSSLKESLLTGQGSFKAMGFCW